MWLDYRFSLNYYLRVIELAIRDSSRVLTYDEDKKILEAVPAHRQGVQEINLPVLQDIIQELFSRLQSYYSTSARFLSIIDTRLRIELANMRWFHKVFWPDACKHSQQILQRLNYLKSAIMQERQGPSMKVARVAHTVLQKQRTNFSSWEDFSHHIRMASQGTAMNAVQQQLDSDKVAYDLMQAMMTFLKSQSIHQPLSLELLDQFLLELTSEKQSGQIFSDETHAFLVEIQRLYSWSHEDFQVVVIGVLTDSLQDVLTNSLGGSQVFSPQGKFLIYQWREAAQKQALDKDAITCFLSETVHSVVKGYLHEVLIHNREALPEHVATVYSIRDHQPALWMKMMRSLLVQWLMEFDYKVYKALEQRIADLSPSPTLWQQCSKFLSEFLARWKRKH